MSFIASLLTTLISVSVILKSGKIGSRKLQVGIQAIAALIGATAFIMAIARMLIIIPTGSVGVQSTQGFVSATSLPSGFHLVNPFTDVIYYSTRLKDVKETIEATSKEGLAFNVDVSIQYQIDPQKAADIYQKIGTDESDILVSRFRSVVRGITAIYPAEAIYSTKRQEVASQMRQRLTEQIEPLGFMVEDVLLREVKLPDTLQAAIQEKLKAEQESRQMTFVLERERQEAERKRIAARGDADAQKIVSQGLTPEGLQLRSIEAMEKLATSANSKVIVVGGQGNAPLNFQVNAESVAQP
jgi:regulator of protease activity HflC (stomatin/prohibitin superfamily)